ncbi:MAG TPA: glycosyltransferase 87 family protein [Nitrososphaerales archaeon]|nr:glycosyltransferase 87 family protein [Nitrososphaerales archaeon]
MTSAKHVPELKSIEGRSGKKRALILASIVAALLGLNFFTFLAAIPETSTIDGGCCTNHVLAKDFSAFYVSAWRLFSDPSNLYMNGVVNDGGPHILPQPEPYKYLPSMLLLISPLLLLDYHSALLAFDALQFLLLVPIAILIAKLLKRRSLGVTAAVLAIALLEPSPVSFPNYGFSVTYFLLWAEGQSKVLLLFLLLLSLYYAKEGRAVTSGVLLGLASFDPRFALLSIPLFLAYSGSIRFFKRWLDVALVSIIALNLPILLLPSTGANFVRMLFSGGISTPIYPYALIPTLTLVAISVVERNEILTAISRIAKSPIRSEQPSAN